MNNPSVPRCLALATLVKSHGSQPHDGFGAGLFFFNPLKCQWLQVDSEQVPGPTLFILVWHSPLLCRQKAYWHFSA